MGQDSGGALAQPVWVGAPGAAMDAGAAALL